VEQQRGTGILPKRRPSSPSNRGKWQVYVGTVGTLPGHNFSTTIPRRVGRLWPLEPVQPTPFAAILVHSGWGCYTDSLDKFGAPIRILQWQHVVDDACHREYFDPTLYQSERYGNSLINFLSRTLYNIHSNSRDLLDFCRETHLNVAINGTPVLSNFDIFAAAGASFTAIDKTSKRGLHWPSRFN